MAFYYIFNWGRGAIACLWKSEDSSQEWVLSFHHVLLGLNSCHQPLPPEPVCKPSCMLLVRVLYSKRPSLRELRNLPEAVCSPVAQGDGRIVQTRGAISSDTLTMFPWNSHTKHLPAPQFRDSLPLYS